MVKAVREAEAAIGVVDYALTDKQKSGREFSRSLYIVKDVLAGEKVTAENIRSIRPGYGLHPKYYNDVLGKTFKEVQVKGTRFSLDQIVK
jgi:pseudaminic acid synthase